MAELTDRQRSLLSLANQLSQNLVSDAGQNRNSPSSSPGIGIDVGIDIGGTGRPPVDNGTGTPPPNTPTNMREVLLSLVNEQVEVTTPFGIVTGTLIVVRDDYIVIVESTGAQVLVRIEKVELVSEL